MTQLEIDVAALGVPKTIEWLKANTKEAQFLDVLNAVKAAIPPANTFHFMQNDALLRYVPASKVDELAASVNAVPKTPWQQEYMDCDKYTKAYLGWYAASGLGVLTVGFAAYTIFRSDGRMLGKHVAAVMVDENKRVYLVEPQDGIAHDPKTYYAPGDWSLATSKQLTFLMIG